VPLQSSNIPPGLTITSENLFPVTKPPNVITMKIILIGPEEKPYMKSIKNILIKSVPVSRDVLPGAASV
jgi:hypothetical protein